MKLFPVVMARLGLAIHEFASNGDILPIETRGSPSWIKNGPSLGMTNERKLRTSFQFHTQKLEQLGMLALRGVEAQVVGPGLRGAEHVAGGEYDTLA